MFGVYFGHFGCGRKHGNIKQSKGKTMIRRRFMCG